LRYANRVSRVDSNEICVGSVDEIALIESDSAVSRELRHSAAERAGQVEVAQVQVSHVPGGALQARFDLARKGARVAECEAQTDGAGAREVVVNRHQGSVLRRLQRGGSERDKHRPNKQHLSALSVDAHMASSEVTLSIIATPLASDKLKKSLLELVKTGVKTFSLFFFSLFLLGHGAAVSSPAACCPTAIV